MEIAECEHALGKLCRREFAGAGKRRHSLVIEQTVGESIELGRLDPLFLAIELYECDALEELPGNGLGHHRARLGFFLAHDEPHLGRKIAASRAAHTLQKGADGKRRIDLERALQTPISMPSSSVEVVTVVCACSSSRMSSSAVSRSDAERLPWWMRKRSGSCRLSQ